MSKSLIKIYLIMVMELSFPTTGLVGKLAQNMRIEQ